MVDATLIAAQTVIVVLNLMGYIHVPWLYAFVPAYIYGLRVATAAFLYIVTLIALNKQLRKFDKKERWIPTRF